MAVRGNPRLREGDEVLVSLPEGLTGMPRRRERSGSPLPGILHEDEHLLVLDKPAGLHTVPDRSGRRPGLHGLLPSLRPGEELRIVHRLDRDTSGCLAVARTLHAARVLDRAFRAGEVHKEYLALVEGLVARDRQSVDAPLGPDPRRPGRVVTVPPGTRRSRSAHTGVEVAERFAGYTLVRLRPTTGRGHQLRVHLRSLGHPIVGDAEYGGGPLYLSAFKRGYRLREGAVEKPLLERMFLHAARLVLPDPAGRADLDVSAPMPGDLAMVLGKLRKFGRLPAGRRS